MKMKTKHEKRDTEIYRLRLLLCMIVFAKKSRKSGKKKKKTKKINVLKFGASIHDYRHFYAIAVSLHKANGNQTQLVLLVSS